MKGRDVSLGSYCRRGLRKPQGGERSPAHVMKGFILALLEERIQELEKKGLLPKEKGRADG